MKKKNEWNIWSLVARFILRNRILILLVLVFSTIFWSTQWKYMQFTYTEANLLPDKHPENITYKSFTKIFGEEGNVLVIAFQENEFYIPKKRNIWKDLNRRIEEFEEINFVLSTENIKDLKKNKKDNSFVLKEVSKQFPIEAKNPKKFKEKLFLELPFYKNLLYDVNTSTIRSIIYMDPEIVNTAKRRDFIFDIFIPLIEEYEKKLNDEIHISGMPYIRTLNAQNIVDEMDFCYGSYVNNFYNFLFVFSLISSNTNITVCCGYRGDVGIWNIRMATIRNNSSYSFNTSSNNCNWST